MTSDQKDDRTEGSAHSANPQEPEPRKPTPVERLRQLISPYFRAVASRPARREFFRTIARYGPVTAASLILTLGLWLPEQSREVYVLLAEDYVESQFYPILHQITAIFSNALFYIPFIAVMVACVSLWVCARFMSHAVTLSPPSDPFLRSVQNAAEHWFPRLVAWLPAFGFYAGINAAAVALADESVANALGEASNAAATICGSAAAVIIGRNEFVGRKNRQNLHDFEQEFFGKLSKWKPFWPTLIAAIFGISFVLQWTHIAQALGSVAILCLFSVALAVVLCGTYLVGHRYQQPVTTVVILLVLGLSAIGLNSNDSLHMASEKTVRDPGDAADPLSILNEWKGARSSQATPILIAAQGGGLYAAYHSAMVLARLYDIHPQLGERVLAVSAVSGGSVGAAVFDTILRSGVCSGGSGGSTPNNCHTDAVRQVLSQDFLSPVLASMLFPDFLSRMLPNFGGWTDGWSRARALEDSFKEALRSFLAQEGIARNEIDDLLDYPALKPWQADQRRPLLMFNTTDVSAGSRMVIAPLFGFKHSQVSTYWSAVQCRISQECASPDMLAAATVSARFPYISPAASLTIRYDVVENGAMQTREKTARFVDGGYFENSGLETARDFIRDLQNDQGPGRQQNDVVLIGLTIVPEEEQNRQRSARFEELQAPIRTLLATRRARGELAIQRAEWSPVIQSGFRYYSLQLDNTEREFTLGWALSENTFKRIECHLWNDDACRDLGVLGPQGTANQAPGDTLVQLAATTRIALRNRCVFARLTAEVDTSIEIPEPCKSSSGGF